MLVNSLGSTGYEFSDGLISQLLNVGTKGQDCDGKGPNFMLSIIRGVNPQDEVESMLAAQMAAVHMATMTVARRLNHVDNLPQQDSASNAFNKLARTFAVQLEALKRYRTGGELRWPGLSEQRFGSDRWFPCPLSPSIAAVGRRVGRA